MIDQCRITGCKGISCDPERYDAILYFPRSLLQQAANAFRSGWKYWFVILRNSILNITLENQSCFIRIFQICSSNRFVLQLKNFVAFETVVRYLGSNGRISLKIKFTIIIAGSFY